MMCNRQYRGFSLIEMLVVITIMGILTTVALPHLQGTVIRQSVRGAKLTVATHVARARGTAAGRGCPAVMHLVNGLDARVWVTSCSIIGGGIDTVGMVDAISGRFDVAVTATADSIVFAPTGLVMSTGWFAVRFVRGGEVDSLAVSPVGRRIW